MYGGHRKVLELEVGDLNKYVERGVGVGAVDLIKLLGDGEGKGDGRDGRVRVESGYKCWINREEVKAGFVRIRVGFEEV